MTHLNRPTDAKGYFRDEFGAVFVIDHYYEITYDGYSQQISGNGTAEDPWEVVDLTPEAAWPTDPEQENTMPLPEYAQEPPIPSATYTDLATDLLDLRDEVAQIIISSSPFTAIEHARTAAESLIRNGWIVGRPTPRLADAQDQG